MVMFIGPDFIAEAIANNKEKRNFIIFCFFDFGAFFTFL